jgi:tetratricopeptide (TPR) repeat protein
MSNASIEQADPADEPHYYFMRGWKRLRLNQLNDAVADFSKTIALSDEYKSDYYRDPAYLARAEAYLRLGRMDEAAADCERVANAEMTWPGVRSKNSILATCRQRP